MQSKIRNIIAKFPSLVSGKQNVGDIDMATSEIMQLIDNNKGVICDGGDERGESNRRNRDTARWKEIKRNKIPLDKPYFAFIMLMLHTYLREITNLKSEGGARLCTVMDDFFVDFTTYGSGDTTGTTGNMRGTTGNWLNNKDKSKPKIHLKALIVDVLLADLEYMLQITTQNLAKLAEKLNNILNTPESLRCLTYDQVETLLLHNVKYEYVQGRGFVSKAINEKHLDAETKTIRNAFKTLVDCATTKSNTCTPKQREHSQRFMQTRTAYMDIYHQLRRYTTAISNQWDTLWQDFETNQANGAFCDKLLALVTQFAQLLQTLHVHGQTFPQLELDLAAYEAFQGAVLVK